jgi:hypothetical protein
MKRLGTEVFKVGVPIVDEAEGEGCDINVDGRVFA